MPRPPRTSLGRAQSAEAPATPTDLSIDVKSPGSDLETRSNGSSSKRNRFLLKRQDCLERGCEGELDLTITPTIVKSSPNSPLINTGGVPSPNLGSPPPAHEVENSTNPPFTAHPSLTTPSFSLDSNPEQYLSETLSSPPVPPPLAPPPMAHRLPSVRVIPDAVDPLSLEESTSMNYGLLHPNFRSCLDYTTPSLPRPQRIHDFGGYSQVAPPPSVSNAVTSTIHYGTSQAFSSGPPQAPPPSTSTNSSVSNSGLLCSTPTEQFGHCPKEREGPALGCNYCWNTTDVNGRILRRKTKYHCPDCQANLCIVPCFQAYHEALEKDKNTSGDHKT